MALSQSKKGWLSLEHYDVTIIGGSVAGLVLASELSDLKISSCVVEEHGEIGEPEKCDGLVSLNILKKSGYAPDPKCIQTRIVKGVIYSPSNNKIEFSTSKMDLVVLDRSMYDKQLYENCCSKGVDVRLGERALTYRASDGSFELKTTKSNIKSKILVDASGPSSAPKSGLIPAAKYEISAEWLENESFHVYLNQKIFKNFFGWIISSGDKTAKVGAAGEEIRPFYALQYLLKSKQFSIIRRIGSPIYVGGPNYPFVRGNLVKVGESAGQVKPTTAGGISLAIASSVIASKWIAESVRKKDPSLLKKYEVEWKAKFGSEMRLMLLVRKFFKSISNSEIDNIILKANKLGLNKDISNANFDFHVSSLLKSLGLSKVLNTSFAMFNSYVKSLFNQ